MNFDLLIEIIPHSLRLKIVFLLSSFFLSSCLGTKYLKQNQTILAKQTIKTDKGIEEETLASFLTQTPNSRVLGLPFSPFVYTYQSGYKHFDSLRLVKKQIAIEQKYALKIESSDNKKRRARYLSVKNRKMEKVTNRLTNGNLRMKWGEELAVYSPKKAVEAQVKLKEFLFSKGYFDARVQLVNEKKGKKQFVKYKINEGDPFIMDSIIIQIDDPKVESIFELNTPKSPLKGKTYDQDVLTRERDRIFELLSNYGYFNFKKQYIAFEVDSTTLERPNLIIKQTISNPAFEKEHRVYRIDSVIFVAGGDGPRRGKQQDIKNYQNITYNFTFNKYPQRILDWRMFVYPDSLYSKSATIETQKQLSYLDIFKFVNINYDTTGGHFIANIFTSPLKKYQTSSEVGLSIVENQAQGLPGPFLNFNAKNRNVFQSLEILDLTASASIQGISGVAEQTKRYSRFQYGAQISVTFPQFILPLRASVRGKMGKYNPRTKIGVGINFEDRISEYKRQTFNTTYSYIFQANPSSQITFKPIDVSFIRSQNSETFKEDLAELEADGNISYVSAFKSAFVSSSGISADYNSGSYGIGNTSSFFVRSNVEYGGLAQDIFGEQPFGNDLTYYRYIKSNLDYRQNIRLSSKAAFAYRANIGVAFVYGQSKALPYEKYFFAGGSNSVRAWSPRRLGPGSYAPYDSIGVTETKINYKREQPGDIIFETSVEFRSELYGIIDYALFIDAGNVWLWRSKTLNTTEDPQGDDGRFKSTSVIDELAVGAGAGLRFDFSFLVLRLDGALKVFDPGMPAGQHYVLDQIRFRNILPRTVLNIGIGYPF